MEMVVISMLRKPLQDEFGIGDMEFAMLGSVVFAGLLIGNLFGGLLADWYTPLFERSAFDILRTPIFLHRRISPAIATSTEIFQRCLSAASVNRGTSLNLFRSGYCINATTRSDCL